MRNESVIVELEMAKTGIGLHAAAIEAAQAVDGDRLGMVGIHERAHRQEHRPRLLDLCLRRPYLLGLAHPLRRPLLRLLTIRLRIDSVQLRELDGHDPRAEHVDDCLAQLAGRSADVDDRRRLQPLHRLERAESLDHVVEPRRRDAEGAQARRFASEMAVRISPEAP